MGSFHVLPVDDEVEFLETLAKRLRKRNIDVTLSSSAQEEGGALGTRWDDLQGEMG